MPPLPHVVAFHLCKFGFERLLARELESYGCVTIDAVVAGGCVAVANAVADNVLLYAALKPNVRYGGGVFSGKNKRCQ